MPARWPGRRADDGCHHVIKHGLRSSQIFRFHFPRSLLIPDPLKGQRGSQSSDLSDGRETSPSRAMPQKHLWNTSIMRSSAMRKMKLKRRLHQAASNIACRCDDGARRLRFHELKPMATAHTTNRRRKITGPQKCMLKILWYFGQRRRNGNKQPDALWLHALYAMIFSTVG